MNPSPATPISAFWRSTAPGRWTLSTVLAGVLRGRRFLSRAAGLGLLAVGLVISTARAQEEPPAQTPPQDPPAQNPVQDPASATNLVQQTLDKIREVEQLDKYINENAALASENKTLKATIASLTKQVTDLTAQVPKLTVEMSKENDRLRKQLIELPNFEVKSKIVSPSGAMAVIQTNSRSYRIRGEVEMSIQAANGIWVLMRVDKITKDMIELHFPELERTITLYD